MKQNWAQDNVEDKDGLKSSLYYSICMYVLQISMIKFVRWDYMPKNTFFIFLHSLGKQHRFIGYFVILFKHSFTDYLCPKTVLIYPRKSLI